MKSIAAFYVALYLVLPNCLCQMLSAFGCDAVEQHLIVQEHPLQAGATVVSVSPICHCDDDTSKIAELFSGDSGQLDFAEEVSSIPVAAVSFPRQVIASALRARGPPDLAFRWSSAPCSGVFRL